jgi:hypothetical protein
VRRGADDADVGDSIDTPELGAGLLAADLVFELGRPSMRSSWRRVGRTIQTLDDR